MYLNDNNSFSFAISVTAKIFKILHSHKSLMTVIRKSQKIYDLINPFPIDLFVCIFFYSEIQRLTFALYFFLQVSNEELQVHKLNCNSKQKI